MFFVCWTAHHSPKAAFLVEQALPTQVSPVHPLTAAKRLLLYGQECVVNLSSALVMQPPLTLGVAPWCLSLTHSMTTFLLARVCCMLHSYQINQTPAAC
jgi:hypothetical protein